jgi:GNAT superfamily N-acetyltransferase
MITQVTEPRRLDLQMLAKCHYGRKMLSNLAAYGTDFAYCRFFTLKSCGRTAWLMLQNSTLLVSTQADFSGDEEAAQELSLFAEMHQPFRIEGSGTLLSGLVLRNYSALPRYVFGLNPAPVSPLFRDEEVCRDPKLDDVYTILSEGFPNIIAYDMWLTDTSHMVRRGLRHCYTYFGVTAATAIYDYENHVLIGQVATRRAARGKGYARDFLHWIANDLSARGKDSILYALDIRKSFYEEIGFSLLESEFVWERVHEGDPDGGKGIL